jgi:pimeloyl-ACP methyl ester carboxylesterase
VILLHGWPDDVRTFERMVPAVQGAGFQTVVPWLRGVGPTSFLSSETMRSGEMVDMAQDTLDLADALKLNTFAVVGHDWGARIAYVLAAVHPERTTRICAMSVGWQPGELPTPALEQYENIGINGSWRPTAAVRRYAVIARLLRAFSGKHGRRAAGSMKANLK